jgi:L-cystine uptake protein TcyP (sodium:dicarboxylate symporter family)
MKTVFVTVVLSILSAVVGIFAATELHDLSASTISSTDKTSSQSSQKIQQWVNH